MLTTLLLKLETKSRPVPLATSSGWTVALRVGTKVERRAAPHLLPLRAPLWVHRERFAAYRRPSSAGLQAAAMQIFVKTLTGAAAPLTPGGY